MTADNVNSWANGLLVASLIFGVIATYAIVVSGNIKEKVLRQELSKANTDAEKAKFDAATASEKAADTNKRAQEIERDNLKLKADLENTIIEADSEKLKLAKMQIDVADARRKQAEAEKSLEQFRQRIQPRLMTTDQQNHFTKLLNGAKGTIDIVSMLGDAESYSFASQIDATLKANGWQTRGVNQAVFTGKPVGLILGVHSAETAPQYAVVLQQAFSIIGFPASGEISADLPAQTVKLIVGTKP